MPVPETAMNKDGRSVTRENHVRFSGNVLRVKAVSEASCVEAATKENLGLCVLAPDAAHIEPSLNWGENISHGSGLFCRVVEYHLESVTNLRNGHRRSQGYRAKPECSPIFRMEQPARHCSAAVIGSKVRDMRG